MEVLLDFSLAKKVLSRTKKKRETDMGGNYRGIFGPAPESRAGTKTHWRGRILTLFALRNPNHFFTR
jgi:hypothetical protein